MERYTKQRDINKNPTNATVSRYLFIHCKVNLHVSGVTALIIRSTKNFAVNKYLHTVASGWIFINTEL